MTNASEARTKLRRQRIRRGLVLRRTLVAIRQRAQVAVSASSLLISLLLGCSSRDTQPGAPQSGTGRVADTELFREVRTIELDESNGRIVIVPLVHLAADTSILLADPKEVRVAHFGKDGALLWDYFQRGDLNGEMRLPVALGRSSEGYWVADAQNGLFLVDATSKRFKRRLDLPQQIVHDFIFLDDSIMVISGPVQERPNSAQHWILAINSRTGIEQWRAMAPTIDIPLRAISSYSRVTLSPHVQSIVAIHSLLDTAFVFDGSNGSLQSAVPVGAALAIPRGISEGTSRLDEAQLDELVRLSAGALIDEHEIRVDVALGTGTRTRFVSLMVPRVRTGSNVQFESSGVLVGSRDGILVSQVDRINAPGRLQLLV